jgi:TetR/AcrR family transcriptional regulator, repressor of fatR-cypB operon
MRSSPLPFYVREDDPPARREVLRAALTLFSERGLDGTSIRDIARKSGYTNPALYKHFASKEELALHLFETCHRRVWERCNARLRAGKNFDEKLEHYVHEWLELVDENSDVIAFLEDSARVLWPKANQTVRQRTMIGLARSLALEMPQRAGKTKVSADLAAASLQGTLGEVARMVHVGVLARPARQWEKGLVALFRKLAA